MRNLYREGLNTAKYTVLKRERRRLFTLLAVDIAFKRIPSVLEDYIK